jgi:hypothetical protein
MDEAKTVVHIHSPSFNNRKDPSKSDLAQRLLLKAISEGITDMRELQKITGMRVAADVYRTLDKMALRREYHAALSRCGIDFDYLVGGIKDLCDNSDNAKIKLKGYEVLLRSLGLDKYDKAEDTGKSWEETIISIVEKNSKDKKEEDKKLELNDGSDDYEVNIPAIPKDEAEKKAVEKEISDSFYG